MPVSLAFLWLLFVCEGIRGPMNQVKINTTCTSSEKQKWLVRFLSRKLIYSFVIPLIRRQSAWEMLPSHYLFSLNNWVREIRSNHWEMQANFQARQRNGLKESRAASFLETSGLIQALTDTRLSVKNLQCIFSLRKSEGGWCMSWTNSSCLSLS